MHDVGGIAKAETIISNDWKFAGPKFPIIGTFRARSGRHDAEESDGGRGVGQVNRHRVLMAVDVRDDRRPSWHAVEAGRGLDGELLAMRDCE